jgi:hypothetical protein
MPITPAIQSASNGSLLTAACMLQRPDLYGAVLSEVPVIDMLRYKKFAAGTGWVPEYGDAEASPDMPKTLLVYSPLHSVKPGVVYPPLRPPPTVTTASIPPTPKNSSPRSKPRSNHSPPAPRATSSPPRRHQGRPRRRQAHRQNHRRRSRPLRLPLPHPNMK